MWLLFACAPTVPPNTDLPAADLPGGAFVLVGATIVGAGLADVEVRDGRITAIGAVDRSLPTVDVTGRWLAPAFIDSHVHLAYRPDAAGMLRGGVAGVVDLAAPVASLAEDHRPLRVIGSGPMVTAVGGYPTRSWGSGGYGLEVADAAAAREAVNRLVGLGAGVIKIPVTGPPQLDEPTMTAAATEAHALGRKVASHALADVDAALAARVGADVLAHTPVDTISSETVDAWRGRAVISSLGAFGGRDETVDNLRRLRAAGVTVLYGTDFGNTAIAGVDPVEIGLLRDAGLDGAAILAAGTSAPAAYWGFEDLGGLTVGKSASLLILARDPLADPGALAAPDRVLIDGRDP